MTPLEINKRIAGIKSLIGDEGVSVSLGDRGQPTNRVAYIWDILEPTDSIQAHSQFYNWAENISDAWELFEEMPYTSRIYRHAREECPDYLYYVCEIPLLNLREDAGSAPMSICLAWLKWKSESK